MFSRKASNTNYTGHPLLIPGGAWSASATQDRLASTLFMAAVLHGIVILGITFSVPTVRHGPAVTSLDVVIVTRDDEPRVAPPDAVLLAEHSLAGHGNAPLHTPLHTAPPAADEIAAADIRESGSRTELRADGTGLQPDPQDRPLAGVTVQPILHTTTAAIAVLAEPAAETLLPDAKPRELLVSASTRESRIASYLNIWKNRVERIGTLNFPHAAELAEIDAYPVLEVAISADGSLREVVVRTSSGHRLLDQAAMEILRIAAPFEPFPQKLRERYDVLRFAYEWHFGRSGGSRVTEISGS